VACGSGNDSLTYEPTGDELYDRFARAVLAELAGHDYHAVCTGDYATYMPVSFRGWENDPPLLSFSAIRDWEDEFSADPRYWQLRAATGVDVLVKDVEVNGISDYDCSSPLKESIDNGIYDAGSFKLLPIRTMGLSTAHEDDMFRYLALAVASDPDNAYWHYQQAIALFNFGEIMHAWDAVRAGNAVPRNVYVEPFPFSTLHDPDYDSFYRGNMVVRGVLRELMHADGMYRKTIMVKEVYKGACVAFALGWPLEMADDMLVMARRMGQAENAPYVTVIVAGVLAQVLFIDVEENLLDLTPAQQAELNELKSELTAEIDYDTVPFPGYMLLEAPGVELTPFLRSLLPVEEKLSMQQYSEDKPPPPDRNAPLPNRSAGDWVNNAWLARYEQDLAESHKARLDILDTPLIMRWLESAAE
jgi:hypothetical protein